MGKKRPPPTAETGGPAPTSTDPAPDALAASVDESIKDLRRHVEALHRQVMSGGELS